MRFITMILFALLPLTAVASDGVSVRDIEDLYEYVDTSVAGNSCKAEAFDGTQACEGPPEVCSGKLQQKYRGNLWTAMF